jgi:sugar lactone lactonase YvrE
MSLNSGAQTQKIIAGTGVAGSAANMLYYPNGIFVDVNFTLYVADWGNSRIQRFYLGQLNGTTVVGAAAPGTISLYGPTGVMMDGDGYLFIADAWDNRIIGSGPYGFRCIVACSMNIGSSSTQLNGPRTLGFDSYGNLYVSDYSNNRIQKFILITNSCGKCSNI